MLIFATDICITFSTFATIKLQYRKVCLWHHMGVGHAYIYIFCKIYRRFTHNFTNTDKTRILQSSAYTLAIFTEYAAWGNMQMRYLISALTTTKHMGITLEFSSPYGTLGMCLCCYLPVRTIVVRANKLLNMWICWGKKVSQKSVIAFFL